MSQRWTVIITVLLVCGCTPQYLKGGVTSDEANRDEAQCRALAARAQAPAVGGGVTREMANVRQAMAEGHAMDDCMSARGYYRK